MHNLVDPQQQAAYKKILNWYKELKTFRKTFSTNMSDQMAMLKRRIRLAFAGGEDNIPQSVIAMLTRYCRHNANDNLLSNYRQNRRRQFLESEDDQYDRLAIFLSEQYNELKRLYVESFGFNCSVNRTYFPIANGSCEDLFDKLGCDHKFDECKVHTNNGAYLLELLNFKGNIDDFETTLGSFGLRPSRYFIVEFLVKQKVIDFEKLLELVEINKKDITPIKLNPKIKQYSLYHLINSPEFIKLKKISKDKFLISAYLKILPKIIVALIEGLAEHEHDDNVHLSISYIELKNLISQFLLYRSNHQRCVDLYYLMSEEIINILAILNIYDDAVAEKAILQKFTDYEVNYSNDVVRSSFFSNCCMSAAVDIIKALHGKKNTNLKTIFEYGCYYEVKELSNLACVDSVNHIGEVDLVFTQFDSAFDKNLQFNLDVDKSIERALKTNQEKKQITFVVDITLMRDPSLMYNLQEKYQRQIAEGGLNLIFITSNQKYFGLGFDKTMIGSIICFSGKGKADHLLDYLSNRKLSLSNIEKQLITHIYLYAGDLNYKMMLESAENANFVINFFGDYPKSISFCRENSYRPFLLEIAHEIDYSRVSNIFNSIIRISSFARPETTYSLFDNRTLRVSIGLESKSRLIEKLYAASVCFNKSRCYSESSFLMGFLTRNRDEARRYKIPLLVSVSILHEAYLDEIENILGINCNNYYENIYEEVCPNDKIDSHGDRFNKILYYLSEWKFELSDEDSAKIASILLSMYKDCCRLPHVHMYSVLAVIYKIYENGLKLSPEATYELTKAIKCYRVLCSSEGELDSYALNTMSRDALEDLTVLAIFGQKTKVLKFLVKNEHLDFSKKFNGENWIVRNLKIYGYKAIDIFLAAGIHIDFGSIVESGLSWKHKAIKYLFSKSELNQKVRFLNSKVIDPGSKKLISVLDYAEDDNLELFNFLENEKRQLEYKAEERAEEDYIMSI